MPDAAWLYGLIVACEAGFWVLLLLALAARYLWQRERLSRWLLLALPGVDLLLLLFTALDLGAGRPAETAHGLATVYVGFTLAFGGVAVAWADRHFAHRFAGGPRPEPAPSRGWAAVRFELGLWLRSVIAWAIALVLLGTLIAWLDDPAQTASLQRWYRIAFGSVFLWFVFGPVWGAVAALAARVRGAD